MDKATVIVDSRTRSTGRSRPSCATRARGPASTRPPGETIGGDVKRNAPELAAGYSFEYGAVFRRLIARR
jgi:hypothetical protein